MSGPVATLLYVTKLREQLLGRSYPWGVGGAHRGLGAVCAVVGVL